jgi:hypothetical protein
MSFMYYSTNGANWSFANVSYTPRSDLLGAALEISLGLRLGIGLEIGLGLWVRVRFKRARGNRLVLGWGQGWA